MDKAAQSQSQYQYPARLNTHPIYFNDVQSQPTASPTPTRPGKSIFPNPSPPTGRSSSFHAPSQQRQQGIATTSTTSHPSHSLIQPSSIDHSTASSSSFHPLDSKDHYPAHGQDFKPQSHLAMQSSVNQYTQNQSSSYYVCSDFGSSHVYL